MAGGFDGFEKCVSKSNSLLKCAKLISSGISLAHSIRLLEAGFEAAENRGWLVG